LPHVEAAPLTQPAAADTRPAVAETRPAPAETRPATAEAPPATGETQPSTAEAHAGAAEGGTAPPGAPHDGRHAPPAGHAAHPPAAHADPQPHPAFPPPSRWPGVMVIVVLGLFLAAAVVGPVVRALAPREVPPAHSHDEPPGASHHHGRSGTLNPEPDHGHADDRHRH
jgi:hypothetical protein